MALPPWINPPCMAGSADERFDRKFAQQQALSVIDAAF